MRVGHVYVVLTTLSRPPKDKITLCICAASNLFFWINTQARPHGIGQVPLRADDHRQALTHDCYLDCSRVTTFLPHELEAARPRGAISSDLAARIIETLSREPPKTLPPRYLKLAIANLSALLAP